MIVIGIDPGKTIGLCLYNGAAKAALDAYQIAHSDTQMEQVLDVIASWRSLHEVEAIAIEWPRIYQKAGNDVADTIAQCGMFWWALGGRQLPVAHTPMWSKKHSVWMYAIARSTVCAGLSAHMGQLVRSDGGVWAALVDLHGGRGVADLRKAGPFACLTGKPHARSALAVAWAASFGG